MKGWWLGYHSQVLTCRDGGGKRKIGSCCAAGLATAVLLAVATSLDTAATQHAELPSYTSNFIYIKCMLYVFPSFH